MTGTMHPKSQGETIKDYGLGAPITICIDLAGECKGWVVIDSTFHDRSVGGLRIAEDVSLEEVRILAREMTLKYAFIGLPLGGAKSGLRIPGGCSENQKRDLLFEFGRAIASLIRRGLYLPWMDMNCGMDDLKVVYQGAGLTKSPRIDSSFYTAISVADALAVCRELLGNPTRPIRIAIEGFGRVAAWLIKRLPADQYIVTAISTLKGAVIKEEGLSLLELVDRKDRFGDELVKHLGGEQSPKETVLTSAVDILLPSARVWSISETTAAGVRAHFIVPIANAPYGKGVLSTLESRGCVCLPGFVVNSGGVFGSSATEEGVPLRRVESVSATHFRSIVRALLSARAEFGISPCRLAEQIAGARLLERVDPTPHGPHYWQTVRMLALSTLTPRKIFWRAYLQRFTVNLIELRDSIPEYGRMLSQQEK